MEILLVFDSKNSFELHRFWAKRKPNKGIWRMNFLQEQFVFYNNNKPY